MLVNSARDCRLYCSMTVLMPSAAVMFVVTLIRLSGSRLAFVVGVWFMVLNVGGPLDSVIVIVREPVMFTLVLDASSVVLPCVFIV